ncbi:cobalt-precorrin-6A reductase [Burkholderia sp. 3C]
MNDTPHHADAPRILLLGGTGDALKVARTLPASAVYSLAGLGKTPEGLTCGVRIGGFGGAEGLAGYLRENRIALLADATHPYAAQISANAAAACAATGTPYWALDRAPWQPGEGDDWRCVPDWAALTAALAPYRRPFFTLGREPLAHLDAIPPHQHWTIRCLDPHPGNARANVIAARGPFVLDAERALFALLGVDVLVSKMSGGAATEAKLAVARERRVPVLMIARPALPAAERRFDTPDALAQALAEFGAP